MRTLLFIDVLPCQFFYVFLDNIVIGIFFFFFFQAEDGIRDTSVTGVQTCALPIFRRTTGISQRIRRSWRHESRRFDAALRERGTRNGVRTGGECRSPRQTAAEAECGEVERSLRNFVVNRCPSAMRSVATAIASTACSMAVIITFAGPIRDRGTRLGEGRLQPRDHRGLARARDR